MCKYEVEEVILLKTTLFVHNRMRQDAEWGGQQELYAAAQCLTVDIYVHQVNAPRFIILCDGIATNNSMIQRKSIHISFHGECHYNSIRLISDDVYDLPSAPISLDSPASTSSSNTTVTSSSSSTTTKPIQILMDTVAQSVPWVSMSDIGIALEMAENDVNDTIEVLMANPQGFSSTSSSSSTISNTILSSNAITTALPEVSSASSPATATSIPTSQSIAQIALKTTSDEVLNGEITKDSMLLDKSKSAKDNSSDVESVKGIRNSDRSNSNSNSNNEEEMNVKNDKSFGSSSNNKSKVKKDKNTISSHRVTINKTMSKKVSRHAHNLIHSI